MALRFPFRVKVSSATTGTGPKTVTETGSAGWRTLTQAVADGDLADGDTVAAIFVDTTVTNGPKLLEVGTYTWDNTTKVLTAVTIHQPNGTAVSWGAGTRDVLIVDNPVMYLLLSGGTMTGVLRVLTGGSAITLDTDTVASFQKSTVAGTPAVVSVISGASGLAFFSLGDTGSEFSGGMKYDNATDTLYLRTAGTDRARIDNAGVLRDAAGAAYLTSVPAGFPLSGTKLLFGTNPPTGWTRVNATEDRVIRLAKSAETVGTATGSWTISGLSLSGTTDAHTLTIAQIPAHTHTAIGGGLFMESVISGGSATVAGGTTVKVSATTGSEGSGDPHTHDLDGGTVSADGAWRPRMEIWVAATKD